MQKRGWVNFISANFWEGTTLFGTPVFYIFAVLVSLKFNYVFGFSLLVSIIVTEVICWGIKFFYFKERPNPRPRRNFIEKIDSNSFPSIHTARISALAFSAIFFYRDLFSAAVGVFLILGVGYSRIYLKHHDFRDVAGGFLIGLFAAVVIFVL